MPSTIIAVMRAGALALVALLALGLPSLRALHEAEHHQHDQQQAQRLLSASGAIISQAVSADDDDGCGACPICQLFLVASHHHAVEELPLVLPLAEGTADTACIPPIGVRCAPGTARHPPARGPPSLA